MTKDAFLQALAAGLQSLSREEREEALRYYREYIEDAVDAGRSEEEVIASLDAPGEIALGLARDAAFTRAAEKPTPRNTSKALVAVFGILSLPIALPIAIALIAVAVSVLAAAFAAAVAILAAIVAVVFAAIVWGARSVLLLATFSVPAGAGMVFTIGVGLAGIAVGIFAVIALCWLGRWIGLGVGRFFRWLGARVRKLTAKKVPGGNENA